MKRFDPLEDEDTPGEPAPSPSQSKSKPPKTGRVPVSQTEVLAWLQANHPQLHEVAALDRLWVWLPVDLRGEENKSVRESIKAYGFRFAKRGHALSDGRTGTWAHCGTRPMPFKRRGKGGSSPTASTTSTHTVQSSTTEPATNDQTNVDAEAYAFAFAND